MRLVEVQRRVREIEICRRAEVWDWADSKSRELYRDTLRAMLDHDLPDDARALIEAALEAER